MNTPMLTFQEQVDGWIRQLQSEVSAIGDELDEQSDFIRIHKEEIDFNYENFTRLESKMDRLESELAEIKNLLIGVSRKDMLIK